MIISEHLHIKGKKVKVSQLHLTLCNPMDYTVRGILQARILEWQPFLSPEDLPNSETEHGSPTLQVDSLPAEPQGFAYKTHKIQQDFKSTYHCKVSVPGNQIATCFKIYRENRPRDSHYYVAFETDRQYLPHPDLYVFSPISQCFLR